ncbi:MAG: substrate-binding domain-containing protein [Actinomycetota bacterium]
MHTPTKRRSLLVVTLLVILSLIAAACGDDSDDTSTDAPADAAPAGDLEGDFLVSGSSTVFPIVQRQAEEFNDANSGVAIAVEGPGSGDGAKKFCAGEAPIANASRLYKDEEIATCEENGIEFIEIRRAIDGISVITSAENDAIECLSFNDLYALISEEAFGFGSWSDANALTAQWGGTEFPDADLELFAPGEESGTFDSFGEIVIESVFKGKTGLDTEAREFAETIRPDYTASPNDNVIIEGIGSSQYSLGWVGYAFAQEAADAGSAKLLQVSLEDGGECVTPTPETISNASFPIARFLYTYVNAEAAANDPSVAAFVDYMLSDAGLESVAAVGYVDLAEADQSLAQAVWDNRTTGRSWG